MQNLLLPGEKICGDDEYIRGHGTQANANNILSTLFGSYKTIDKLIMVQPLNTLLYSGNIGDVVVGRIDAISNKKWMVDLNCKHNCTLHLSAINISGESRRKDESDEIKMREYFNITDILIAEVQKIGKSGCLSLHTRSEKYGKGGRGYLKKILPMLIPKHKTYFFEGPNLVVVVGLNGSIFIKPKSEEKNAFQQAAKMSIYFERCAKNSEIVDYNVIYNILEA